MTAPHTGAPGAHHILARDTVQAFTRHTHVTCAGSGAGPLAGLDCGIKDLFDVAGQRTGFGSPDWLASHGPATATAPAVQRLLDAGARVVGKTHTEEIAWSLFGENAHYGTPVNVNAPGRVPGGSSSGSAAAVAAGLVDFALGSDTGGSVRYPASVCGILGVRPTHGRIPLEGACALAPSFDTAGWFARDAEVLARVGRVLLADTAPAGACGEVLLARDAFDWAGPAVTEALAPALRRLAAALGEPRPVQVSAEGYGTWAEAFRDLQAAEAWAALGPWVTAVQPALGPGIRDRVAYARQVDPALVTRATELRARVRARALALLADGAVLLLPTAPGIAPLRGSPPEVLAEVRARAIGLLSLSGLAGTPQITLPLATLEGCPLGLSLMAAPGRDTLLLELAQRLLAAVGG